MIVLWVTEERWKEPMFSLTSPAMEFVEPRTIVSDSPSSLFKLVGDGLLVTWTQKHPSENTMYSLQDVCEKDFELNYPRSPNGPLKSWTHNFVLVQGVLTEDKATRISSVWFVLHLRNLLQCLKRGAGTSVFPLSCVALRKVFRFYGLHFLTCPWRVSQCLFRGLLSVSKE